MVAKTLKGLATALPPNAASRSSAAATRYSGVAQTCSSCRAPRGCVRDLKPTHRNKKIPTHRRVFFIDRPKIYVAAAEHREAASAISNPTHKNKKIPAHRRVFFIAAKLILPSTPSSCSSGCDSSGCAATVGWPGLPCRCASQLAARKPPRTSSPVVRRRQSCAPRRLAARFR